MDVIGVTSNLVLYLLLIAAVIGDLRFTKISNRLILVGFFLSAFLRWQEGGIRQIIRVLPNLFFPVVVLLIFYLCGALGAGDIKLFSLAGSFMSFQQLKLCMVLSFVSAAVWSFLVLLKRHRLWEGLESSFLYLWNLRCGIYGPYPSNAQNRMHFSAAILTGVILMHLTEQVG